MGDAFDDYEGKVILRWYDKWTIPPKRPRATPKEDFGDMIKFYKKKRVKP